VERKADKPNRGDERPHYDLSSAERDLVERVVMAESEDEPYIGQMLVCQCILNACRLNNKRPAAIIKQYAYATRRPNPSESVIKAVSAVFDKGEIVTDEPIIYFYAPALVDSAFHERQRFVTEVNGHRFFAED
jgi:spore germination cell wall hydrolase CwlJ-like protein